MAQANNTIIDDDDPHDDRIEIPSTHPRDADGLPVVHAFLRQNVAIVPRCCFCKGRHSHSTAPGARHAHCFLGSYSLKFKPKIGRRTT